VTASKTTQTEIADSIYEIGKFVSATPMRRFSRNPVSLRALHRSMVASQVFPEDKILISKGAAYCGLLNI
jgi:hypothetical protein